MLNLEKLVNQKHAWIYLVAITKKRFMSSNVTRLTTRLSIKIIKFKKNKISESIQDKVKLFLKFHRYRCKGVLKNDRWENNSWLEDSQKILLLHFEPNRAIKSWVIDTCKYLKK